MKDDDDFNLTIADAQSLRKEMAAARKWMTQWQRDKRKIATLERKIEALETALTESRAKLKANVAWIKATDAATLGGGITLNQLARRRKAGIIPRHGWRQVNSRVFEYRHDVILSLTLV